MPEMPQAAYQIRCVHRAHEQATLQVNSVHLCMVIRTLNRCNYAGDARKEILVHQCLQLIAER